MVCGAYRRFLWIRRYRFQLRSAPYGRFLRSSHLQKPIYENHVCPLFSDDSCFHTARCLGRRKFPGRFAGKSTVQLRIPCGASSGKVSFHPHQLRLRRSRRFFLPLLVIGALIGSLEGELLISAGILSALYLPNIIIIAMVAFFAASIRAPITGTLLILEMTGDFHHLTALALASAVAYVTAELLKGQPIYDSLLKNPCPMVLRPFPTKKEIFWKFPWAAVPSSKTGQWRKSPVCLTRYSSISKGRGQI